MNNRQVNANWAIGGEAYDIARVPGGAASKGGGGGTGEGGGGGGCSDVNRTSYFPPSKVGDECWSETLLDF